MAELKQIEVNGTTYDIGIPGSELPVICETYGASWTGATIADKMNDNSSTNVHYQELSSNILLKRVSDGDDSYCSVVIAVANTDLS